MSRVPIGLYVPNILCYLRIVLSFVALTFSSKNEPHFALLLWIAASLLDLIDGPLARWLKQMSSFGVLLDIIADIVCRSSVWMAVAVKRPDVVWLLPFCLFIISVEWLTFFSTQFHASAQLQHWKQARSRDPKYIRVYFRNRFRNPLGIWGILGLFCAGMCAYIRVYELYKDAKSYRVLQVAEIFTYSGRLLSLSIEIYLTSTYFSLLLTKPTNNTIENKNGKARK